MDNNESNLKKALAKIPPNLIDLLGKFQEIELHDVELNVDELELVLPQFSAPLTGVTEEVLTQRPTELIREIFTVPSVNYTTQIVEVKLGATKAEGGKP